MVGSAESGGDQDQRHAGGFQRFRTARTRIRLTDKTQSIKSLHWFAGLQRRLRLRDGVEEIAAQPS